MKLNRYQDFISESVPSGKMMIFYSDAFRDILSKIFLSDNPAKEISRRLLAMEDNGDFKDTYTLIDRTDKNDMISYVQTSRFYREYPHSVLDKQRGPFIKNSKFWTSGRTPQYGIGRWTRHIFNDVRQTPISNEDLENFVNAYKSTYDKIGMRSDGFEIVKGEDIRYWYLEDRYEEVRGQLGKSCMRKEYCQKYLDIYVENPEVCSLLILKGDTPDKIIGRALIWTIHDGPGVAGRQFMDRIYTIEDSDMWLFDTYAKEHNIFRSQTYTYKIKVKEGRYDYYPYMDTFTCYDYKKGILTSGVDGDEEDILGLQNTDGTASDNSGRVWSEYHGEYIDEDDARYCEDVEGPVHYENAVWLEYKDIYVTDNADTVYSEYLDGNYYTEDVVHSECLDDYLDPDDSDIIEFYTDSKGNTDYCTKYDTQYYIEIEDKKFYSRDRYIADPYTGEYHFKDDIVDGVEFIKGLDERLEKELDIKEKYTKEDGSFDLTKYKKDIKEELFAYEPSEAFLEDMDLKQSKKTYSSIGRAYLLPAFYAWIIRDESAGSVSSSRWNRDPMFRYMKLAYDLLEEIPEESLASAGFKGDKEDIKKFYKDKFQFNSSTTNLVSTFESIDLSKLPSKIYKMIVYMNM